MDPDIRAFILPPIIVSAIEDNFPPSETRDLIMLGAKVAIKALVPVVLKANGVPRGIYSSIELADKAAQADRATRSLDFGHRLNYSFDYFLLDGDPR